MVIIPLSKTAAILKKSTYGVVGSAVSRSHMIGEDGNYG